MPVALVTWNAGRAWGLTIAGLSAVATRLADVNAQDASVLVPSWNAVVWFAVLAFVVWILSALRGTVRRQRMQIEEETEVSDDLRNQNDIKNTLLHAVSHDLKGPLAGSSARCRRSAARRSSTDRRSRWRTCTSVIEQAGRRWLGSWTTSSISIVSVAANSSPNALHRCRRARPTGSRPSWRPGAHPSRVESDPVMVDIDPGKVERIVENLLVNAARHTPRARPSASGQRACRRRTLASKTKGPAYRTR